MPDLVPYPFGALVTRAFRELERNRAIFDLPVSAFYRGDGTHDSSVDFHGRRASSPLGPAAGPHTQMAQNMALAWLGGSRILELKTVQIRDDLVIPRPCIDMQTIGLNVEWSQELKLSESLAEYVKGAMLIEMLRTREETAPLAGFGRVHYDMSVGYDLAGIRSPAVSGFICALKNAAPTIDWLRREIPAPFRSFRDLDYPAMLSDTVTLSTFHGCPPQEIETIIDHLLHEHALHSVIKFNPMLLGPDETRSVLNDVLGYRELIVPDTAFERDTRWEDAVEIVDRLRRTAASLGLTFGVKLTNTLIVENHRGFLPASEKEAYLSGPPLHVLAMRLVQRFRHQFGDAIPISFSAGIDRHNFPDAVALGLTPVTVSTDLLKPRGYGRLAGYHQELAQRMDAVGARSVPGFILRAYGKALDALSRLDLAGDDPRLIAARLALDAGDDLRPAVGDDVFDRWVSAAILLNTDEYVTRVLTDGRYANAQNRRVPRKIGRHLQLFDCITCNKCIPVCPNDAIFACGKGPIEIPRARARRDAETWTWHDEGTFRLTEKHQIAAFADFCNECGNCDVFCPEDGGPYLQKPLFFGTEAAWHKHRARDGIYIERHVAGDRVLARLGGVDYELQWPASGRPVFAGTAFRLEIDLDRSGGWRPRSASAPAVAGDGPPEVDLTPFFIMDYLRRAVLDGERANYVNCLWIRG